MSAFQWNQSIWIANFPCRRPGRYGPMSKMGPETSQALSMQTICEQLNESCKKFTSLSAGSIRNADPPTEMQRSSPRPSREINSPFDRLPGICLFSFRCIFFVLPLCGFHRLKILNSKLAMWWRCLAERSVCNIFWVLDFFGPLWKEVSCMLTWWRCHCDFSGTSTAKPKPQTQKCCEMCSILVALPWCHPISSDVQLSVLDPPPKADFWAAGKILSNFFFLIFPHLLFVYFWMFHTIMSTWKILIKFVFSPNIFSLFHAILSWSAFQILAKFLLLMSEARLPRILV